MNREQRRTMAKDLRAQVQRLPDVLTPVPEHEWPVSKAGSSILRKAVWRSKDFLVQVFYEEAPVMHRVSVNRTTMLGATWVDGITWDELQKIKHDIGFGDLTAVEIYPPDDQVVNVANMRHLWVMNDPLPYTWRPSK